MSDFKVLIRNARDERETGDAEKALEMFLQIDKSRLESDQLLNYLEELGLTYWHLKKFDEARAMFEEALKQSNKTGNRAYQAMSLRHLSRPEFNEGKPDIAVKYAQQARQLAFEEKREDLAWFDHGIVTALIFNKAAKAEIKKWFDTEAEDLYKVSQNTKDKIAKWVWFSGLLIDRAKVSDSVADLYLAMIVADQFNLARRKEQIEELIKKFNSK